MKELSIKFVDFWPGFNEAENLFVSILKTKYDIHIIGKNDKTVPDLLFYSVFGVEHYEYENVVSIYFSGENDVPNFNECDYAISCHHIQFGNRHFRLPLFVMYRSHYKIFKNIPNMSDTEALSRGFCSVVMRNVDNCSPTRLQIIDAVDNYKQISYGGPYRNNVGGPVENKSEFISKYKFNLALENSSIAGYITEKILEPFASATVPIYWGAEDIGKEFNPDAFINVSDYNSIDNFIADLKEIDNSPERYLNILRSPRLKSEQDIDYTTRLSDFLTSVVEHGKIQRPMYGASKSIYIRNMIMMRLAQRPKLMKYATKFLK